MSKSAMTSIYFETENNPAPAGLQAGYFQSADGFQLRYALCKNVVETPRQGTVILLHGRNEAFEKYFETIADLNKRGFCVATMDWRGQGGSFRMLKDAERGYVRNFADYRSDFEIFLKTIVMPDCPPPFYILAHSTGALIALQSHEMLQSRIQRMVLASPFLGLARSIFSDRQLRPLATLLAYAGFGSRYAGKVPLQLPPESFARNPLTHDQTRYIRNATITRDQPQLGIAGPTIQWLAQTLRAIHSINNTKFYENFSIPTLFLVPGADRVVDPRAAIKLAENLRTASLITIDGAYHELLQESDFYREQVWAAFDAFIPGSAAPEQLTEPALTEL
ncbi:MAG: alpha/beta hydrolase [Brucellaceae bacterium]|jgi:lysophospholipase|nr:alpha/beta hydrolase [Brucellaceae bacterium]